MTVKVNAARLTQGEDFEGQVVFANRGSQRVAGMTGILTGGVRADGDDHMAGAFTGAIAMVGTRIELDPGATTELPLTVGTASCLPDASYVVPPGRYEVVAAIHFRQTDGPQTPRPVLVARGAWVTVEAITASPEVVPPLTL